MTLLTMVNEAQDILSIGRSNVVISSTDTNVRLLLALANQEGRALMRRHNWTDLITEKTFTSVAAAAQTSSIPTDFDRMIEASMFNRTQNRRVTGPINAREWQAQQAIAASVLTDTFRIQAGTIYIIPTPDAGDTYAYEYVSKNFCESSGGTGRAAWAADSDVGVLDETLMVLGLIWRFRKARGFDYGEEFTEYESQVVQARMRDGSKRSINYSLDESLLDTAKVPSIPEGGWNL